MKAKFLALAIVLGMSAPVFANGPELPVPTEFNWNLAFNNGATGMLSITNLVYITTETGENTRDDYAADFELMLMGPIGAFSAGTYMNFGGGLSIQSGIPDNYILRADFLDVANRAALKLEELSFDPEFSSQFSVSVPGVNDQRGTYTTTPKTAVPEPSTILLLGSGLLVGAAVRKRLQ